MNVEKDYLTVREVAERLRLSLRSTYRLLASGRIVGQRRGERGGWLIRAEDADAYLTTPRGPAQTPRPAGAAARDHEKAMGELRAKGYRC